MFESGCEGWRKYKEEGTLLVFPVGCVRLICEATRKLLLQIARAAVFMRGIRAALFSVRSTWNSAVRADCAACRPTAVVAEVADTQSSTVILGGFTVRGELRESASVSEHFPLLAVLDA